MDEYIDRGMFNESVEERYCKPCKAEGKDYNGCRCRACWVNDMIDEVDCFQPADVAPVVHRPCPYCDAKTNDFITINQTVEYSGIEIALNRQGMLRVRVYESGQETFNAQDIVEIKFCPNCGAKMDGGAD